MYDDSTVELILTADGAIKNIVFVEELVEAAPKIPGWKFTSLKPALKIEDVCIDMGGYKFDRESLFFTPMIFLIFQTKLISPLFTPI